MSCSLVLHYVFDPLCGWCYGAAPLVQAARELEGLDIAFHAGGMFTGDNRRPITTEWREYVMKQDQRIARHSGQPFGNAYFDGLLLDRSVVLDSGPPITAILAAEAMAGIGLDMLHELQRSQFVCGLRIADAGVLRECARDLGLDVGTFTAEMQRLEGRATSSHIAASRALLLAAGGRGFPTFALDDGSGGLRPLQVSDYLGKVEQWRNFLRSWCIDMAEARAGMP